VYSPSASSCAAAKNVSSSPESALTSPNEPPFSADAVSVEFSVANSAKSAPSSN